MGYIGNQSAKIVYTNIDRFRGEVADIAALNATTGMVSGDMYKLISTNHAYMYDGNAWVDMGNIEGPQGPKGNGISSIERTSGDSSEGTTDTYTITYDDNSTSTFDVTNGTAGTIDHIAKTDTVGTTDTYTAYADAAKTQPLGSFEVYNGADGGGGGVDYTATTNPLTTTNPENDGAIWNNYSTGEIFVCTDRTTDANKWIGTNGTIVLVPATAGFFGRIWNITDDVYKRYGVGLASFSPATNLEFDSWLSPTAERVNDDDTNSPCDLTIELDTNPNLPFSTIARKVVNKTGVVSTFDHATAPTTNEQIMSEIQKTHYIHAIVATNSKEYDVQFVSLNPFTVDAVNDLGLTDVTSITCFNPTAGISSGTVSGNVITSALHPAYAWHDGSEASDTYIGSFPSVTGRSTFGSKATATITLPTARTQHTAFGTNFNQHDFWNESLNKILAYIERGSNYFEGSLTKWDGFARSGAAQGDVQNCGLTLSLQNKTGVIKDGSNRIIANSYRGIENYHSNLRMWVDGININNGKVYLAKAGSTYVSDISVAPYFDSGYVSIAASSGNIEKWLAGTFIPNPTAGGTSTSKVTDTMYGGAGWRVLIVSGFLLGPGFSGLSYWNAAYDSSTSDWSIVSRASFRKFLN